MLAEPILDRAVEGVADGRIVDWELLDSQASDPEEREQLKWLRILGEIADLHRSTSDGLDDPGPATISIRGPSGHLSALSAASTWGRYALHEKVGAGTFGSVYRAWDPELEREIAIKILHSHVSDDRLRERLLHEGRALARVRHHNVVSVLGVEAHEHRIGLCMEFVQGETLDDHVKAQGTLSAREAVLLGEDVCRALAAVHGAGFVHRDVKARNIMRESAGRIVLMDFGTGREARLLEAAHPPRIAGTPLYMAPEVLAGEPASTRSDVYSVGVLLFFLVTGAFPVDGRSLEDLRTSHDLGRRRRLAELRADLPPSFIRVVEQAIDADPDARQPHAAALVDALHRIYGDGQSTTTTIVKRLLSLLAVLAVGACVSIAVGFLSSTAFNVGLDRWEFASESPWQWLVWGLRASVLPLFLLMLGWLVLGVVLVFRRLAVRMSSTAAAVDGRWRRAVAARARRLALDDISVLSSGILLLSSAALMTAWWYHWPLVTALATRISTWPLDRLWLLSPASNGSHDDYRVTFSALVLFTVAAWYGVLKLADRRGQIVNRSTLAGGAAIVGLSLASLSYPYRLLRHSSFETASWNGERCYIIGERADTRLLFCPGIDPPATWSCRARRADCGRSDAARASTPRSRLQPATSNPG